MVTDYAMVVFSASIFAVVTDYAVVVFNASTSLSHGRGKNLFRLERMACKCASKDLVLEAVKTSMRYKYYA